MDDDDLQAVAGLNGTITVVDGSDAVQDFVDGFSGVANSNVASGNVLANDDVNTTPAEVVSLGLEGAPNPGTADVIHALGTLTMGVDGAWTFTADADAVEAAIAAAGGNSVTAVFTYGIAGALTADLVITLTAPDEIYVYGEAIDFTPGLDPDSDDSIGANHNDEGTDYFDEIHKSDQSGDKNDIHFLGEGDDYYNRGEGGQGGEGISGDRFVQGSITNAAGGDYVVAADYIAGDDIIIGNDQTDLLVGDFRFKKTFNSELTGGDDILVGNAGEDELTGDVSLYKDNGVTAGGVITGGDDTLVGGSGADDLLGDIYVAKDVIGGTLTGGDDRLVGGTDGDTLIGDIHIGRDATNAILEGGDDILIGGAGNDTLTGDFVFDGTVSGGTQTGGADTFVFTGTIETSNVDTVTDYSFGENDVLDVSDLLIGFDTGTDVLSDFVQLVDIGGGDTELQVKADGTGAYETVAVLNGVVAGDHVLVKYDDDQAAFDLTTL